jgi:hypothetical protein
VLDARIRCSFNWKAWIPATNEPFQTGAVSRGRRLGRLPATNEKGFCVRTDGADGSGYVDIAQRLVQGSLESSKKSTGERGVLGRNRPEAGVCNKVISSKTVSLCSPGIKAEGPGKMSELMHQPDQRSR